MKQASNSTTVFGVVEHRTNKLASTAPIAYNNGYIGSIVEGCETVVKNLKDVVFGIAGFVGKLAEGLSYENMKDRDYMIG